MEILFSQKMDTYASSEKRNEVLSTYADQCVHNISGEQIRVDIDTLVADLREKADWYAQFIRNHEWVSDEEGRGWFNGYYDNSGRQVEGVIDGNVRMMLTGQVFSIMGNVADDVQVKSITESADKYLYKKDIGGYRLNTDFKEEKFDLGRMFGFAYGEKENGAVFSHMTVMYANALYQRGFVREGYKALYTLLGQAMDLEVSRMYPGIPEYFDAQGRGKYPYLTGAASWYMMTVVTQIYGFRGLWGDLMIEPKILLEQFDTEGNFSAEIPYRGQTFSVVYQNPGRKEYGKYQIGEIWIDGSNIAGLKSRQLTTYRRKDVGFVFQFYNLVQNLTAKENVELASEICDHPLPADQVLAQVGLKDRMQNFPAQLSGGEQQRVSIARALAKNPKLLLCDEPTGALDYVTGKQILKLLYDTCKETGKTVFIITHNQAICPMADRVIRIKNGRVQDMQTNLHPVSADEIEW